MTRYNVRDDANSTPLHIAALKDLEDVVILIQEFNCDTRVRGNCGRTLLHIMPALEGMFPWVALSVTYFLG